MDKNQIIQAYEEAERRGLLSQLPQEKQDAWAEYKRRQKSKFSEEALAQVKANNEAYAKRQEENRPWFDKNPVGRMGVALAQGIANATFNPAGYAARAMGMDTRPFEPQNALERGTELAGQYGYDAAALTSVLQGYAPEYISGTGLGGNVVREMAKGGIPAALATSTGAAYTTGAINPENQYARMATDALGAIATGRIMTRPTTSVKQGGLDKVVGNRKDVKTINSGIRANEEVAQDVVDAIPQAKSKLQEEMMDVIDKTVGRKLDRELAYDNAQQSYNDYIAQNANRKVLDVSDGEVPQKVYNENGDIVLGGNKVLDKNGKIGYNGAKGENNEFRQISENGERGQVQLQQEQNSSYATGNEEERLAALGELVRKGRSDGRTSQDGLFIRRDDGTGVFSVNPKYNDLFDKAGVNKSNYIQLKETPDEARRFFDAISSAKEKLGDIGEQVWTYSPEEYQNMKLFLSEDGLSGVAVKPDGDIVSVFNSAKKSMEEVGSRAHALVELAKQNGGKKLDAFDTFLPKLYSKHGFKETSRDAWNNEFAPEKWNRDFFKKWNNGEPDVVYMQLDETPQEMIPNVNQLMSGLSENQQRIFNSVLKEGSSRVTNPEGSLKAVHRALERLNRRITATVKAVGTTEHPDVKELMAVKNRINQALDFGGIKPYDARIAKAKTLSEFWQRGYNAKPSDYKLGKIDFKNRRNKQAFLQGVMQKMVDNVTPDTNIADTIRKNETIFRNILPKKQYENLLKRAGVLDTKFKRLNSLERTANWKLMTDAENKRNMFEKVKDLIYNLGASAADSTADFVTRGGRSRNARELIKPEAIIKQKSWTPANTALGRQGLIDVLNYYMNSPLKEELNK